MKRSPFIGWLVWSGSTDICFSWNYSSLKEYMDKQKIKDYEVSDFEPRDALNLTKEERQKYSRTNLKQNVLNLEKKK